MIVFLVVNNIRLLLLEHLRKLVLSEKARADSAIMEKTQIEKIIKEQRTALLHINAVNKAGDSGILREKSVRERFVEEEDKALLAELLWLKQRQYDINQSSGRNKCALDVKLFAKI
jgi:hypothetical protein